MNEKTGIKSAHEKFAIDQGENFLTKRDIKFVKLVINGKLVTPAAREAGFPESVCYAKAHAWITEFREESTKPHVWDYHRKLLRKALRIHDVNPQSLVDELSVIAFSDISNFIEIPTRAEAIKQATTEGRIKQIFGFNEDESPAQTNDEIQNVLQDYKSGEGIKLKFFEDVNKKLWPAVKSIENTRDGGIKIVLHSKLDAIEKLCKYLKMFSPEGGEGGEGDTINIQNINIVVKGSKSPLMGFPEPIRKLAS